eukprot:g6447.t3
MDEMDAITHKREAFFRGMEKRIVAQLLTIENTGGKPVVVIGATNRPNDLDSALRRAGRFDREICVGVPDLAARARISQLRQRLPPHAAFGLRHRPRSVSMKDRLCKARAHSSQGASPPSGDDDPIAAAAARVLADGGIVAATLTTPVTYVRIGSVRRGEAPCTYLTLRQFGLHRLQSKHFYFHGARPLTRAPYGDSSDVHTGLPDPRGLPGGRLPPRRTPPTCAIVLVLVLVVAGVVLIKTKQVHTGRPDPRGCPEGGLPPRRTPPMNTVISVFAYVLVVAGIVLISTKQGRTGGKRNGWMDMGQRTGGTLVPALLSPRRLPDRIPYGHGSGATCNVHHTGTHDDARDYGNGNIDITGDRYGYGHGNGNGNGNVNDKERLQPYLARLSPRRALNRVPHGNGSGVTGAVYHTGTADDARHNGNGVTAITAITGDR